MSHEAGCVKNVVRGRCTKFVVGIVLEFVLWASIILLEADGVLEAGWELEAGGPACAFLAAYIVELASRICLKRRVYITLCELRQPINPIFLLVS